MDLLEPACLARARPTLHLHFWNDYLGLSPSGEEQAPPPSLSANSITESLKATLGLDDRRSARAPFAAPALRTPPLPWDAPPQAEGRGDVQRELWRQWISTWGSRWTAGGTSSSRTCTAERAAAAGAATRAKVCVFLPNNGAPEEVYAPTS
ncbi:unnamed protein product [Boreogadus saida]